MRFFKIFILVAILALAGIFLLNYQTDNMQKGVYDKDSVINQESDTQSYRHYDQNDKALPNYGLDLKFGTFDGCDTFYRLNVSEAGTVTIKYDARVEQGRFKIVVAAPGRKLTKLAEGSGAGSKSIKLAPGDYRVKIVGDNATGSIKMSVLSDKGIQTVLEGDEFLAR